ncbi:MAG: histidine kinase [bacterium]|nr:histidine kinase [bacterium]
MRNLFFLFVLLNLGYAGLAQSGAAALHKQLQAATADTARLPLMLELSNYYRLREPDSSKIYARQAEALAQQLEDDAAVIRALLIRGMLAHRQAREQEAVALFHRAARLAGSGGQQALLGSARQNLALVYKRMGRQDSAFYYFTAAEQDFTEGGNPYENWHVYFGLSELYEGQGQTREAEAYLVKALQVTQSGDSRMDQGFVLYHLAEKYFMADRFADFAKVQQQWEALQQDNHSAAEILEHPGHYSMARLFLTDDTATLARIDRAYGHYLSGGNLFMAGWSQENRGQYFEQNEQPAAALQAYEKGLRHYTAAGAHLRRGMVQQRLYQLYKARGETAAALMALEQFRQLSDSLNTAEAEAHLRELQVAYETDKKEQALRIQDLEIRQKTQQRNGLIGLVALLVLLGVSIGFGLVFRLRTQQRLSAQSAQLQEQRIQQLEQQQKILAFDAMLEGQEQERARIAQDLHDGLGGLLTSVKAHFGQYATTAAPAGLKARTQALIDESCVEVRRISHNLMPRSLALYGLKGAVEDLAGQLRQSGLRVDLEIRGDLASIPERQQVTLYRMLQEGTNNILRHAQAQSVLLQILLHGGQLTLILEDDGQGFKPAQSSSAETLGLKGLRSRAQFLQGTLDIDSVPLEGTTITFQMPVGQPLNPAAL